MQSLFLFKPISPTYKTVLAFTIFAALFAYALGDTTKVQMGILPMIVGAILVASVIFRTIYLISNSGAIRLLSLTLVGLSGMLAVYAALCNLVTPHFRTLRDVYGLAIGADRPIDTDAGQVLGFYLACGLLILIGCCWKYRRLRRGASKGVHMPLPSRYDDTK